MRGEILACFFFLISGGAEVLITGYLKVNRFGGVLDPKAGSGLNLTYTCAI